MRNIDELKTELACLQSESKLVEKEILNTAGDYVNSVKNIFSSIKTGGSSYSHISSSNYAYGASSWANNIFVKLLQKSIRLLSPFLITVLTPKSKKWYAPFIAKFIDYGLKAISCVNYIYIARVIFNTIGNRCKSTK